MTAARALAHHGLRPAVVDTAVLEKTLDPLFDGRASAIASASSRLFKAIGLWELMEPHAQPIWEIRVTDGDSPLFLHFDGSERGALEPLGYMFENRQLRHALYADRAQASPIDMFAPAKLVSLDRSASAVDAVLDTGVRIRAPLVLACEGRRSPLREQAGIHLAHWRYSQAAVITTVHHALPHGDIAHERFHPEGPFAILPLADAELDGARVHRSSIVLTVAEADAPAFMALGPTAFQHEITRRFGDFMGEATVHGPRWSYPLTFQHADRYIDQRLALVGDAAHGIHPIAGQGFNMGLRDVAALTQVLVEAARLGQDLGDPVVLKRYQQWRRTDNVVLSVVTDGLNRLFSNDRASVRMARRVGLAAVHRLPPLKRFFMTHARGAVGKLPKLLQGVEV
jgi:2-octaprenyl-6-methoxyphenol hydroxylase